MAAELKTQLNVDSALVVGSPGEFTVWVDGHKIAEKVNGVFPEPDTVIQNVRARAP